MAGPVYVGSVKAFHADRGWGHIECSDTFQIYGKDIFLLRSQLQGATSVSYGTQVSFRTVDNGRGPEAVDVTVIDPGSSGQTPAATKSGGSYIGVIKSFNPVSGWGHIQCPQTEAIYGKDIFFMKSQIPGGSISKGTSVSFSVGDGLKGPEANTIKVVGGPMNAAPQMGGYLQLTNAYQQWGSAPSPSPRGSAYYGTVKSFNEEKGWGHITCQQTQTIYGKDMFVMRSSLNGATIKQGDSVQFQVVQGMKGPEASAVKVLGRDGGDYTYAGSVKQFSEEKGWGFIACEETRSLYGKDIFIHKNHLQGYSPSEGESVEFSVQISPQGRPEATRMVFGTGRYNAVRKTPWGKGRVSPF
mmetsp:Transcript_12649/g.40458  ORF Transcript_12649/g.40458 Transcript_12649/m.40458 type:complete len:356 (-) Transcript_12649:92-1159(-)